MVYGSCLNLLDLLETKDEHKGKDDSWDGAQIAQGLYKVDKNTLVQAQLPTITSMMRKLMKNQETLNVQQQVEGLK